jgi:mRNA-degrading endonuclease RelE of RelBE toxin-antitoxin system
MLVTFEEYNKKEKEANDYKDKILKLIDAFIDSDKEFVEDHIIRLPYKGATDFYFDNLRHGGFVVTYAVNWSTDTIEFTHKEYLRLLKFMENPDLYKSVKNIIYN